MRTKGKILFDDTTVVHPVVEEAKRSQRQKQEETRLRREARPEKPLLNRDRYPEKYAEWLKTHPTGHGKQPHCWMCREAIIHWDEPAHECEGFKPMFEEHDEEWHERMETRREAIREAMRNGTFYDENESGDYCEGEDDDWVECEDDDCEDDGDPMWE